MTFDEKVNKIIGKFKAKLILHFCKCDYQVDKSKWKHPDNTCIPTVIERDIEKMRKAIENLKEVKCQKPK